MRVWPEDSVLSIGGGRSVKKNGPVGGTKGTKRRGGGRGIKGQLEFWEIILRCL